jgi:hypothetical protein
MTRQPQWTLVGPKPIAYRPSMRWLRPLELVMVVPAWGLSVPSVAEAPSVL